jgi:hypothetical protein
LVRRKPAGQVYLHRVLRPTHAAITAVETDLARAAESLGGRNDGWGCLDQGEVEDADVDRMLGSLRDQRYFG